MHVLWKLMLALGTYEASIQAKEIRERHRYYGMARQYCDRVGKPLLRIGMRRSFLEPPNGDVTLDINPAVLKIEGGILGDERAMPFEDKEMGVSFNEHTLEHLYSAEDVELAVNECVRVADYAILLCPSPYSIIASLFCPAHNLRLFFDNVNNRILVRPNNWRTGLGLQGKIGQAMIVTELKMPAIISSRRNKSARV